MTAAHDTANEPTSDRTIAMSVRLEDDDDVRTTVFTRADDELAPMPLVRKRPTRDASDRRIVERVDLASILPPPSPSTIESLAPPRASDLVEDVPPSDGPTGVWNRTELASLAPVAAEAKESRFVLPTRASRLATVAPFAVGAVLIAAALGITAGRLVPATAPSTPEIAREAATLLPDAVPAGAPAPAVVEDRPGIDPSTLPEAVAVAPKPVLRADAPSAPAAKVERSDETKSSTSDTKADAPSADASESEPATTAVPQPVLPPFDASAAAASIAALAGAAASCADFDDPTGTAQTAITFAPSGRVTMAVVEGAPFAGTHVGSCIANRLRGATVPPFAGSPVTVRKAITIR